MSCEFKIRALFASCGARRQSARLAQVQFFRSHKFVQLFNCWPEPAGKRTQNEEEEEEEKNKRATLLRLSRP